MPHTWIVWGICTIVHSHITIQEMSAVRRPLVFENCQIFYSGLRKHFLYVCNLSDYEHKFINFFANKQHSMEHCK